MEGNEWKRWVVQRWEAERCSRPGQLERERWPRTIDDLRKRLNEEGEPSLKGDLYHRLSVALIKNEEYSSALLSAEEGLALGRPEWEEGLSMQKAKALYLGGREEEALTLLDRLAPAEKAAVETATDRPPMKIDTEVRMVCPGCGNEVTYGEDACPQCGKEVGEGFVAVRRLRGDRSIKAPSKISENNPVDEVRRHRIRKLTLLFSIIWVDHDDPEHFFNTVRVGAYGSMTSTSTREGFVKVCTTFLVLINLLLAIIFVSRFLQHPDMETLTIGASIWSISVLPIASLFLWAMWPIRPVHRSLH